MAASKVVPKTIKEIKKEEPRKYYCTMCPRSFDKQEGNFPGSASPLFANNNKKLPICNSCLDTLSEHYTEVLGSEKEAVKRICMKFDIYWSEEAYELALKVPTSKSLIKAYISKINLRQFANKNYDLTIEEEGAQGINSLDEIPEEEKEEITEETIRRFGKGLSLDDYKYLEEQYQDWINRYECETKVQEELYKNLSIAQLNILKAQRGQGGKMIEAQNAFNNLLGTANIKPAQTAVDKLSEQNTLGTLLEKWENEYKKPVPEPPEQWKDYYGIVRYINIFFLGHLCKMLGIRNNYSRMYDEEMSKYKIERPEYEEDEEALFDAVFGEHLESNNVNEGGDE